MATADTHIAVVICCFNSARTIEEAYESATSQSRPAAEVVIVDDGSTDPATRRTLARLTRHGARVESLTHRGVACARNEGVGLTVAPYIVLLDGDDRLAETCLEQYAARLDEDSSLAFISSAVQAFEGADYIWTPPALDAIGTLTRGSVHVSSMFRRTLWNAVGGFDYDFEAYEDLDFWLRALRLGFRGEILDTPLLQYRVRADSRYRRALEPDVYRRTMARLVAKHADFVRTHAVEILREKDAFISGLKVYNAGLRAEHDGLTRELAPRAEGYGLVLAYHRVARLEPDTHGLCVAPVHFREHLDYLRRHCTLMPLAELLRAARGAALPPRAVAITFDDGYADALSTAAPILIELDVPATFFVNTARLDDRHEEWHDTTERIIFAAADQAVTLDGATGATTFELVSPDQRRAALMAMHDQLLRASPEERQRVLRPLIDWAVAAGQDMSPRETHRVLLRSEIEQLSRLPSCTVGSHTTHHLWLTNHAREVQDQELLDSRLTLESITGQQAPLLAYPFGAHDARLEDRAREVYEFALTIEPGLVTTATDSMRVPRLEIRDWDATAFAAALEATFAGPATGADAAPSPVLSAANPLPDVMPTWESNYARGRDELKTGALTMTARPQFLIIDPTSRCNARCVMCPVSFRPPGDNGVDLDGAVFAKLAPLLPTATHVNLFASGEPTIAKDIARLLEEAQRLASPHTQIWLSTNGKHLPAPLLERLAAPQMVLQLSVDGGTRPVFEAIRRGIGFDELIATLEMIKAVKQRTSYPRLSFSCTISKRNLHDLVNIFALAATYGVDHVSFYEEDPEVPEEETFALDANDRAAFEAQRPAINATGVPYTNGLVFKGTDGLRASEPPVPASPPVLTCSAPWTVFHQRSDGSVRTCCTLRRSMGNMLTQTFDDVWNGDEYVKLRRAFVEQVGIPGTCYRCTDPLRTWGATTSDAASPVA